MGSITETYRASNNPMAQNGMIIATPATADGGPIYMAQPIQQAPRKPSRRNFYIAIIVIFLVVAGIGAAVAAVLVTRSSSTANVNQACLVSSGTSSAPTKAPTLAQTNPPNVAFNIDLKYRTTLSPAQQTPFEQARVKWQTIITADFATAATAQAGTFCGANNPTPFVIDDIVIFVTIKAIDGVGGVLGQAGPCAQDASGKIRAGTMEFDQDDFAALIAKGTANSVVLHEMAHVLGFGTVWEGRFS
jgi:hypothetical protein